MAASTYDIFCVHIDAEFGEKLPFVSCAIFYFGRNTAGSVEWVVPTQSPVLPIALGP